MNEKKTFNPHFSHIKNLAYKKGKTFCLFMESFLFDSSTRSKREREKTVCESGEKNQSAIVR